VTVNPLTSKENLNNIEQGKSGLILSSWKKFLCSFVGYFDGRLHQFELDNSKSLALKPAANGKFSPLILIVARQCYTEQAKEYPIDSKSELNKLLALESSKTSYHHVWNSGQGKSQVNSWEFSEQVPNAFLTVPESFLCANQVENNQIAEINGPKQDTPLYVAKNGMLLYSSLRTSILSTSEHFALSAGIASCQEKLVIRSQDYFEFLATGLKSIGLEQYLSFFKGPQVESRLQLLKNIAFPCFLVLGVYLAATSAYLGYKKVSLQQELDSHSSEVTQALAQQDEVDTKLARYYAMQNFLETQMTRSALWLAMADIFPKARLTNIRTVDDRIVIRGSTGKATDVLEQIESSAIATDAKFDFPTRRNRNRDVFVISFKLVDIQNKELAEKDRG